MVKLSNGESLEVIGTVSIRCSFAVEIDLFPKIPRDFVVFENLTIDVPLIMGRDFLQQTQTLIIYRDRLQERKSDLTAPKVMNMTLSRRRLPCYLDYILVYAIADTGSDLNLVKEGYAIERGFLIEKVSEMRDLSVCRVARPLKSPVKSKSGLTQWLHRQPTHPR